MKTKSLLILGAAFLTLTGCSVTPNDNTNNNNKYFSITVKNNESLDRKSEEQYPFEGFMFQEVVPIFEDGHIDHFGAPIAGEPLIKNVVRDGYILVYVGFFAQATGSLHFNINSDASGTMKDALRVELYHQVSNTSVIYSDAGGESITEGKADLNADGQPDKDPMTGEEIIYTNGQHSYNTVKFDNTTPFMSVNNGDELGFRVLVYIDGFQTETENYTSPMYKLELSFEVK